MDGYLKLIAEKVSGFPGHGILNPNHIKHKKPINSFRNLKVVGLQAIVDNVFSRGGEISKPNIIDVTEYFLLEENFGVGLNDFQESLGLHLYNRVFSGNVDNTRL